MMEAASTSETSVNFYQTTLRNNPESSHLREYLLCCLLSSLCFIFQISPPYKSDAHHRMAKLFHFTRLIFQKCRPITSKPGTIEPESKNVTFKERNP
jgi:hypothetical protein